MASKNKAEKKHLDRVAQLGCIVCRLHLKKESSANAHHINSRTMGRRSSDFETIPLCPAHHQYADGSQRFKGEIAVHRGLESFEARYGTERELLGHVRDLLGISEMEI